MRKLASSVSRRVASLRHLSASQLFVVVIIAVIGGLFPVPGGTTPVTIIIGRVCQCSATEIALAGTLSFLVTPLQIVMIPLWGRCLAAILGRNTDTFTFAYVKSSISNGNFLISCLDIIIFSVLGWLLTASLIVFLIRLFIKKRKKLRNLPNTFSTTQALQNL